MTASRIPSTHCLLSFDTLARLRSVTHAAEALSVTPSAISHRIRQLETQLGVRLFQRGSFVTTVEGEQYLMHVRRALHELAQVPRRAQDRPAAARVRLSMPPTFARQAFLPRLALFRHAYPDIELVLQVTIPLDNSIAEPADIEVRFGHGPFEGVEQVQVLTDRIVPACSPGYLQEAGSFEGFSGAAAARARLLRSPLEPWTTWFRAFGIRLSEPTDGGQFEDLGLMYDAAAAGFGVALVRHRLGAAWFEDGRLVRLSSKEVASPHHHFLCWQPGTLDRWECAAFVDWLTEILVDDAPRHV